MTDFNPDSPDEDSLQREVEDTPEYLDDTPLHPDGSPMRKRGRPYNRKPGSNPPGLPPGSPKQPGSGRRRNIPPKAQRVSDEEIAETLRSATPKIIKRLCEVATGAEVWQVGSTGKPVAKPGTLLQQLKAAELVLSRTIPSLSSIESVNTNTNIETVANEEDLRKALREHLASSGLVNLPQSATDAPQADVSAPLPPDLSADIRAMKAMAPDSDDGFVHLSDKDAIREFERRATIASGDGPEVSGRIDLGEGFHAVLDRQAGTLKQVWRCFNAEGQFCANKSTPEAVRQWFEQNTIPGQLLAKAKAGKL
jgi:hypothetical protein